MNQITNIITEYIDEERNVQFVDVYYNDNEEGVVAAEICLDTGKVFYRDSKYRSEPMVKETINLITKTIDPVDGAKRILKNYNYFVSLWHTDDICYWADKLEIDLTKEEIATVQMQIEKYHDANTGINWSVIEYWILDVFQNRNLK